MMGKPNVRSNDCFDIFGNQLNHISTNGGGLISEVSIFPLHAFSPELGLLGN